MDVEKWLATMGCSVPAQDGPTEEEIAEEICKNLRLKLTPEKGNQLAKRSTENVEAYHLYLKGRFYWAKRTEEGLYPWRRKPRSPFRAGI